MSETTLFHSGRQTVQPDWIDYNGHMNVGYYLVAFDKATDVLCDHLGCGGDYRHRANASIFVLEAHVTFDREVREGDPLTFSTQVLDADAKRVHLIHFMHHARDGFLAATNELIAMHMDLEARRSAPFPDDVAARVFDLRDRHASLPAPPQVGRAIGIRRRPDS